MDDKKIKQERRRAFLAGLCGEMTQKGISQKTLSERTGLRPTQISLWLNGHGNMNLDALIRLSSAIHGWEQECYPEDATYLLEQPRVQYQTLKPSLGSLIKTHLAAKGYSQKELGDRVGTSQSRISEYIRGAVVPSIGVAARICKELDINPEDFVDACSQF